MLLAQVETFSIPAGFDNWLLNLTAFVVLVAAGVHIWKSLQSDPSMEKQLAKLREEVASIFATKAELRERVDMREETAQQFREEIKTQIKDLDKKLSDRSSEIFDAVRSLGREISHLEGQIEERPRR